MKKQITMTGDEVAGITVESSNTGIHFIVHTRAEKVEFVVFGKICHLSIDEGVLFCHADPDPVIKLD